MKYQDNTVSMKEEYPSQEWTDIERSEMREIFRRQAGRVESKARVLKRYIKAKRKGLGAAEDMLAQLLEQAEVEELIAPSGGPYSTEPDREHARSESSPYLSIHPLTASQFKS